MAGFRSLQTDAAKCKQLHLQSLFSFRRLAPADDYLGSPFSASFRPLLLGFRSRFPVISSFFPLLPLPFRSASARFWILSFLFFLSALHRFRLPVAFPTPRLSLSLLPDLPRSSQLVSRLSSPVLLIRLSCLFPFALPCFAPTAVPQVLQLPSGLTLLSAGSSVRPFALRFPFSLRFPSAPLRFLRFASVLLPPWISPVLPLRSRPFRTPLLGLCFFLSLLQASASQWLPLCRPALRLVSLASFVPPDPSNLRFLRSSVSAPHFVSPLGSLLWFVFLPRSPSRRPLSVPLVRFAPDLVLGSAALPFTAPGFASQLLLPFAIPPSQVWVFPFASFFRIAPSDFPPFTSGCFQPSAPFVRLRFGLLGAQIHPEN